MALALPQSPNAANRLARFKSLVVERWADRLSAQSAIAAKLPPEDLHGKISRFLDELEWALRPDTPDEVTSLEVCAEHGEQRSRLIGYTLADVIREYSLLRQILYEVLQRDEPLDSREQLVVLNSIERAMSQAAEKYSDAVDLVRRQFVAILAHDLRNPLSGASLCAQLILRKAGSPEVCALQSAKILNNLRRADHLIQDLLDVSRLEAGLSLGVKKQVCDLKAIAVAEAEEFATIYGQRFEVIASGTFVGSWYAEGMRRVMENLLSNAVKYGAPDSPIRIELERVGEEVHLRVQNHGSPLTPEEQAHLATPYYRTQAAVNGEAKGWGLGLAMVRGMLAAHGGRLLVSSSEGEGNVFTAVLPIA
jgi:signal transduction histidine kinase